MKLEYLFAILLIAFGTFAVSYGILDVTSKGAPHYTMSGMTSTLNYSIPLLPIMGGVALIAGVLMVLITKEDRHQSDD